MNARFDSPVGQLFLTIDGLKDPSDEFLILDKVKQHIAEIKETNGDINHLNWMPVAIFSMHRTCMRTAIIRNASQTVKLLLEAKANYDYDPPQYNENNERCDMFSETYLFTAVKYQATECAKVLLEKYRELGVIDKILNEPPKYEYQHCLGTAVANGDVAMLKVLIGAKADVFSKDLLGRNLLQSTTLKYLIMHRDPHYLQCMEELTKAGLPPVIRHMRPIDYKIANQKKTKFIAEHFRSICGWEPAAEKIFKSASFPVIKETLEEKNPGISFDLIRIICEYVDHDVRLNSWELFVFEEKQGVCHYLRNLAAQMSVMTLAIAMLIPVKSALVMGLASFGFVAGWEANRLRGRYHSKNQECLADQQLLRR